MAESKPPLRLRGGGTMSGSGSGSDDEDEDAFMSAAEELDLSPTLQHYETPALETETNLNEPSNTHPGTIYGITEKDYEYMMEMEEHPGPDWLWNGHDWIVASTDNGPNEDANELSNSHHYEIGDYANMANIEDNGLLLDMQQGVDARIKLRMFLQSTSTSNTEDEDTDPDEENTDHRDDDDDDVAANLDYLIQQFDDGASENSQQGGQNLGNDDGGSSWQNSYAGCEICQHRGFIAFHLRHSVDCLRQLRAKPHLRVKGSDEAFIIKVSLLEGECPSPVCPSGRHTVLSEECFDWWIADGWDILGWKGEKKDADLSVIESKIKRFLLNHKARSHQQNSMESQEAAPSQSTTAADHESQNYDAHNLCRSCDQRVDLIPHFHQNEKCLGEYMRYHLPEDLWQRRGDSINMRLSIFQVAAMMNVCARVECATRNSSRYIGHHINRNEDCLEFYRSEGIFLALSNWTVDIRGNIIGKKIAAMKRNMNEKKVKERSCGCLSFQKELSGLLGKACSGCGAMGPDVGEEASTMTTCGKDAFGNEMWSCSTCLTDNNSFEEIRQRTSERLRIQTERLKRSENQDENDFILMWTSPPKNILVPSSLTNDYDGPPFVAPNLSTVILVPRNPPALETLLGLCDRALKQKTDLNRYMRDSLRSPIFTEFGDTYFCIYRSLLSDIRYRMNKILLGISSVARGEVVSINPNVATAVKRNPNLRMTISGAMQEECW